MPRLAAFLTGDILLFITALIWGFAFVAQRAGMEHIGPYAFNAVRYLLGAVSLVPVYWLFRRRAGKTESAQSSPEAMQGIPAAMPAALPQLTGLMPPLVAGVVLFAGASLQQVGLVATTAGNAAFITSLYVILVPFIGRLFGKKIGGFDWLASFVAVAGLWLITMRDGFSIAPGDFLEFIGAFFWAAHIIVIGRFATRYDPILLSIGQFTVAGLLSLAVSLAIETTTLASISQTLVPILYGGLASCGIAYTLQIFGQKTARPSHASIILALEGLFGAIGGIIILGEPATARILAGGSLMIFAAILPQILSSFRKKEVAAEPAAKGR